MRRRVTAAVMEAPRLPDAGPECTPVAVRAARVLVTLGPDDPRWAQVAAGQALDLQGVITHGCLARVAPPATADDAHVALVVAAVRMLGASAVRVVPRPRGTVLPGGLPGAAAEPRPRVSVRAVVESLVAAANATDREALRALTEAILTEAGL